MTLLRGDAVALPLADNSVDVVATSPPYFSLRSYEDAGEHYAGQIGSEPTPADFLAALWKVTGELQRVLKPSGSIFVNLGDKYAGSGGHNNAGISASSTLAGNGHRGGGPKLRSAPRSYNREAGGIRNKSLMGLPWRYAIGCIDGEAGPPLILRGEVIWDKPNGIPEPHTDRVRRSHEHWFHLTKSERYFSGLDELREPHQHPESPTARPGPSGTNRSTETGRRHEDGGSVSNFAHAAGGRLPGSVWSIPSEPLKVPEWLGVDHYAAFPQEWPRRIILGWSPNGICTRCGDGRAPKVDVDYAEDNRGISKGTATEGRHTQPTFGHGARYTVTGYACSCPEPDAPTTPAVVLDPFAGTGTVVGVAEALGRRGIGVELSADYLRLARWRVESSGHFAKTEARTNAERQGTLL